MNHEVTVIIPVIRPEKAARCVAALEDQPCEVLYETDNQRIGCPKMVKRLVSAVKTPYVVFLGDDTIPHPGMIQELLRVSKASWIDAVGLVAINDQVHQGGLPTHWMAHMDMLPLLDGEFFSTEYVHGYCDYELMDRCRELGKYAYAEKAILTHDHPALTGKAWDKDYSRIYSKKQLADDFATYKRRLKARVGWGSIAVGVRMANPSTANVNSLCKIREVLKPGDVILNHTGRLSPASAANWLAHSFIGSTHCQTLLMIDDDMVFNGDDLIAMRDAGREYDIMCALAVSRNRPHNPLCIKSYDINTDSMTFAALDEMHGVVDVAFCGLAFTFVRRWVVSNVARRVNNTPFTASNKGEDYSFCVDAIDCGARIGCNCNVNVGHIVNMALRWNKTGIEYAEVQ